MLDLMALENKRSLQVRQVCPSPCIVYVIIKVINAHLVKHENADWLAVSFRSEKHVFRHKIGVLVNFHPKFGTSYGVKSTLFLRSNTKNYMKLIINKDYTTANAAAITLYSRWCSATTVPGIPFRFTVARVLIRLEDTSQFQ